MSPYAFLGSSVGTAEAASLCVRLTAWHDAMVAHERRLRTGRATDACDDECPHAEYTGIALEFGTEPLLQMMQALRGDHWLYRHPEAPAALAADIKRQLLEAFYVDTDAWKGQLVSQARQAMFQAVDGLAA